MPKPLSLFTKCSRTTASNSPREVIKLEVDPPYVGIIDEIADRLKVHYIPDEILRKWGRKKLADYLVKKLPAKQMSRSGELGEILATEYINSGALSYEVPIKRLRWKDTRDWPMRGEDVVGFIFKTTKLQFLKGEVKSRKNITDAVVSEARQALDDNLGLPVPYTLAFIVERLYESGEDKKAEQIEDYVTKILPANSQVAHLIFTFSQNDPISSLVADSRKAKKVAKLYAVGLIVKEHQEIIRKVYVKAQNG